MYVSLINTSICLCTVYELHRRLLSLDLRAIITDCQFDGTELWGWNEAKLFQRHAYGSARNLKEGGAWSRVQWKSVKYMSDDLWLVSLAILWFELHIVTTADIKDMICGPSGWDSFGANGIYLHCHTWRDKQNRHVFHKIRRAQVFSKFLKQIIQCLCSIYRDISSWDFPI